MVNAAQINKNKIFIILSFCDIDFEYVVTKKLPPRICFGTGLARDVLPIKGPCVSSFMKRNVAEVRPNLGPGSYDIKRDAFYDVENRVCKYDSVYEHSRLSYYFDKERRRRSEIIV